MRGVLVPVLFVAFLVMPLVELWVIFQVGSVMGAGPTILLLLVDSIIGAIIVRREGRRAWQNFRTALNEGRWPGDEVAQGALVLVGGALLLTPGFVTDVMGLAGVLPPTRALLSKVIRERMRPAASGPTRQRTRPTDPPHGKGGQVLDVEIVDVQRLDDDDREAGDGTG